MHADTAFSAVEKVAISLATLCSMHREMIGLQVGPGYCRTTSNIAPAGYDFLPDIVASTHHQLAKEDD